MEEIQEVWNHLSKHFPEMKGIPLNQSYGLNHAYYIPPQDGKEWGVFITSDLLKRPGADLWDIKAFLQEKMLGTGIAITNLLLTQFSILHEIGHHQHCLQYMKENKTDGLKWMSAYAEARFEMISKVEQELERCGVLPSDFEATLYREISFEKIADQYAVEKLIELYLNKKDGACFDY